MSDVTKKTIIGILGGIGSGKSTVAAEFAKLGCAVIDADELTHRLLETDTVKRKLADSFGQVIFTKAGKIDRKKLADLVFEDNDKLAVLDAAIHPLVFGRVEELIEQYNRQNNIAAIVVDMPLLAEVGWDKRCDKLIFLDCEEKIRLSRSQKKGIFSKNQLKIRENFQISLDNKAKIADYRINNNSDISALTKQVARIFSCITNNP